MNKKQQIGNIRAESARYSIPLTEITAKAGLPYNSVRSGMHYNTLSQKRIDQLTKALDKLIAECNDKLRSPGNYEGRA